jgi:hypothetical protein
MTFTDIQEDTLSLWKRLKSTQEVGLELASRDIPVGVDGIHLWYPSDSVTQQEDEWLTQDSRSGLARLSGELPFSEHGGIQYGYKEHSARTSTIWVRISPSTAIYGPKSLQVATLSDTKNLIRLALSHLFNIAAPLCSAGEIRISRLDLTRDIHDIARLEEVLHIATPLLPHKRLDTKIYSSPLGTINSISRRTSKGDGPCLYNKSRQSGLGHSVLRFEMRFGRKNLLKECPDIQHLTEATISQLFFDSFDPVAAGLLAIPEDAIREAVSDQKDRRLLAQLIGDEVLKSMGYFPPTTKYGRTARSNFFKKYPLINIQRLISDKRDSNYRSSKLV